MVMKRTSISTFKCSSIPWSSLNELKWLNGKLGFNFIFVLCFVIVSCVINSKFEVFTVGKRSVNGSNYLTYVTCMLGVKLQKQIRPKLVWD